MTETNNSSTTATNDNDSRASAKNGKGSVGGFMVTMISNVIFVAKATVLIFSAFYAHAMFTGNYEYFNMILPGSKILFVLHVKFVHI